MHDFPIWSRLSFKYFKLHHGWTWSWKWFEHWTHGKRWWCVLMHICNGFWESWLSCKQYSDADNDCRKALLHGAARPTKLSQDDIMPRTADNDPGEMLIWARQVQSPCKQLGFASKQERWSFLSQDLSSRFGLSPWKTIEGLYSDCSLSVLWALRGRKGDLSSLECLPLQIDNASLLLHWHSVWKIAGVKNGGAWKRHGSPYSSQIGEHLAILTLI